MSQSVTDLREQFRVQLQRSNQPGECNTRAVSLRTVDSTNRTVEVVATTEDPALVFDYQTYRIILEVLLMDGGEFEEQTPLLRDHNQYNVTAICGSFTEPKAVQDRLEGLITVGKGLDDTVEGIWRRIEQGHLRRVSIGYDYGKSDYVTIAAGETAIVGGRTFTAPKDRDLRVVKRWRLRELSLVVIPADARALMKAQEQPERRGTDERLPPNSHADGRSTLGTTVSDSTEATMKKFIAFLHKCGLAAHITDVSQALAWARSGNLTADQITEAAGYAKEDGIEFDAATCQAKQVAPTTTGTRSGSTTTSTVTGTNDNPIRSNSAETDATTIARQVADETLAAERARINQIRTLGREHSIADDVVNTAIDNGHSIDQAREAFLNALRTSRQPGAPAIHSRGGLAGQAGVRILQAACLMRAGIDPDSPILNDRTVNSLVSRQDLQVGWACNTGRSGERRDNLEQVYDQVRQLGLHNASMMRLAQELYELETNNRAPYNTDELLQWVLGGRRSSYSSANFSVIWGATVHMMLWAGYASAPATYERFCDVDDVPDFRDNSEVMMGEVGRLKKQSKTTPGKAVLLNMTDPVLSKVAADRYAGMLKVTEQNFINDSLGALGTTPDKLGQSVRSLIADLVMAQLLSTSNLADTRARYNTTDGNLVASGGTADVAGLKTLEKMMRAVKVGDRRISLGQTVIVTGITLGPNFRTLRDVRQKVNEDNPFSGTFELVEDTAIDIGLSDPSTDPETAIAGRPNSYFGFCKGAGNIKVVFRQGTNRGPITRTKVLDEGEWGLAWDVYVDAGAAFVRRTGTAEVRT